MKASTGTATSASGFKFTQRLPVMCTPGPQQCVARASAHGFHTYYRYIDIDSDSLSAQFSIGSDHDTRIPIDKVGPEFEIMRGAS